MFSKFNLTYRLNNRGKHNSDKKNLELTSTHMTQKYLQIHYMHLFSKASRHQYKTRLENCLLNRISYHFDNSCQYILLDMYMCNLPSYPGQNMFLHSDMGCLHMALKWKCYRFSNKLILYNIIQHVSKHWSFKYWTYGLHSVFRRIQVHIDKHRSRLHLQHTCHHFDKGYWHRVL